jgi:hypothetical protein
MVRVRHLVSPLVLNAQEDIHFEDAPQAVIQMDPVGSRAHERCLACLLCRSRPAESSL